MNHTNSKTSPDPTRRETLRTEDAWMWVVENFPFPGYVRQGRRPAYLRLVEEALRVIGPGARILDFGAGPADKTALFALCGYDVVAYDDFQDPWHQVDDNLDRILSFARAAGVDYRVGADPFTLLRDESFDVVMLHHVLEHLHDSPRALLVELTRRLRPGGLLYVTVPNAVNIRKRIEVFFGRTNYPSYPSYYWYPGPFRGHVREYVRSDLVQMAKFLDLRILTLRSYFHFPQRLPSMALRLLDFAAQVAPGWRDSWMLIAAKPMDWKPEETRTGRALAESLGRGEYYDYGEYGSASGPQQGGKLEVDEPSETARLSGSTFRRDPPIQALRP